MKVEQNLAHVNSLLCWNCFERFTVARAEFRERVIRIGCGLLQLEGAPHIREQILGVFAVDRLELTGRGGRREQRAYEERRELVQRLFEMICKICIS